MYMQSACTFGSADRARDPEAAGKVGWNRTCSYDFSFSILNANAVRQQNEYL